MADPRVALVLLEQVVVADLLGKTDALESAHVLAAGGDEGAVDGRVHEHDHVHDEVLGGHLGHLELVRVGVEEVAPQQGRIGDSLDRARGHRLGQIDREVLVEDGFRLLLGPHVVIHHVEAEVVGELGVDAVAGVAAAKAVAPVALDRHRLDGVLAAHQRARLVADAHQSAATVDLEGRLFPVGGTLQIEDVVAVRERRGTRRGHPIE